MKRSIQHTKFIIYVLFSLISISSLQASDFSDIIEAGGKEFQQRCALCHGENGRGNGPYSFMLITKPSDLSKLLIDNEGIFPYLDIFMIIDGREAVKSHGPRNMPIWGERFNAESWSNVSSDYSETLVRGRIFELVMFIYSIQDPVDP